MATQIEHFITRTNKEIKNGLIGISAISFKRGGTAMDVLKSKQKECLVYNIMGGTKNIPPTLSEIAEEMNLLHDAIDDKEGRELFVKRRNGRKKYINRRQMFTDITEMFI